MNELIVRVKKGGSLAVPAALDAMTTYVVLEQEEWFEKELDFLLRWLKPGMTAIDIGANVGVYSLAMARAVGPHGHVFAYEPGSAPRSMLERSRGINRTDNVQIIAAAVSDSARQGHLTLGWSSELNSLDGTGPGEPVQITCLDQEDRIRGWDKIDFVKIDAEGEEERVLSGARSFFARHSPLVQFEIQDKNGLNEPLRSAFLQHGYKVYRLHRGASVLVPDALDKPIDSFELNLFAAKADRAAALAHEGLLLDAVPDWTPDAQARDQSLSLLRAQEFAPAFGSVFAASGEMDAAYRDGLAGYAVWRSPERPAAERCAALEFACRTLLELCQRVPTLSRLSTLARASWEAGQRDICATALKSFGQLVAHGQMNVGEPFWPASPRFDGIPPGDKRAEWLLVSAFEQFERASAHSSLFKGPIVDLDWLCAQPFVSAEMERRRVLRRAVDGERMEVPARLCVPADDHLNADLWRAGLVPNTWVRDAVRAG
jgi:FkbM family methyltransferase